LKILEKINFLKFIKERLNSDIIGYIYIIIVETNLDAFILNLKLILYMEKEEQIEAREPF